MVKVIRVRDGEVLDITRKIETKKKPHFQKVVSKTFIGLGFDNGDESVIHTQWVAPEFVQKGDKVKYRIPYRAYIEIPSTVGWERREGPEAEVYVLGTMGELTFRAPKGVEVYVELWGIR
jgi:hypothetical protein